jgi:DNA (cytosine-5)-methyltransferase 1
MLPILTNTDLSGAGLMDIGLQSGGLTLQQSFEIEAICCDTLRRNFAHEVVQCDITKKLVTSEKECHVMVATYPCTRYSPIGDIHGVRTGDDLFLHFFRHVAIRRPELYVVENVPGMKKFPVVMEAMTKLPDYYVHVACPVKSSIWLPQKRDRLIIIGSRRNFAWREPAAEKPVTLAEILEPDPAPHIPDYVGRRLAGAYRDRPIISDAERGGHRAHLRGALCEGLKHETGCGRKISARRAAVHGARVRAAAGSAGHIHFRWRRQ